MKRDELAARLLEMFVTELDDQVGALNQSLLALETNPDAAEPRRAAFRVLHTLKGAARAAGVPMVESACHRLEGALAAQRADDSVMSPEALATLFHGADALADAARRIRAGTSLLDSPLAAIADGRAHAPVVRGVRHTDLPEADVPPPPDEPVPTVLSADVRVRAEQLDALLGASGRLLIASGRIQALEDALDDLRITVTAAVAHASANVGAHAGAADGTLPQLLREVTRVSFSATETARTLQAITSDIGLGVRALRLRPFADAVAHLPRLVRDAAAATGTVVQLEVEGEAIEADRTVLDEMRDAISHLVRNAVAHGIEAPDVRRARGKLERGVVRVAATVIADHLVVTVQDDGMGFDVAAIRSALRARGETPSDDDRVLARRLFEGGLSTRHSADLIAGRGVGLDAVRAAMARVRGTVDVAWRAGHGATFTLEAPVALATIRAVLVAVGGHTIAIPSGHVVRLLRLTPDAVRMADGRAVVPLGDAPVPLVSLARLLGPPLVERTGDDVVHAVVLASGGRSIAVVVDELVGEDEVVLRPVLNKGPHDLPFVSGAALLQSGKVALVVTVAALVGAGIGAGVGSGAAPVAPTRDARTRRRVLVADDSITTRTLEQSVLETAGYEVLVAADGAEAWRVLQGQGADLVVSDVEMPRMDGFALCEAIRASVRFRELPVILVTALETAADRARGIEAGADAYLAKSSFDQEQLLDTIRQLVG